MVLVPVTVTAWPLSVACSKQEKLWLAWILHAALRLEDEVVLDVVVVSLLVVVVELVVAVVEDVVILTSITL